MSGVFAEKYSKVYPSSGEKHFGYRYDYEHEVLERVTRRDSYTGAGGSPVSLMFMDWVVLHSVNLCQDDWETNPQYWVGYFSGEVKEEVDFDRGSVWDVLGVKKPSFGLKLVC